MSRVLVIKHGALGDFIQALGPMQAIRRHHAAAAITLLTTPPFLELAGACPYVDEVWVDEKPSPLNLPALLRLGRKLRSAGFERVYDLQTSDRSSWYLRLCGPKARPEWSGIARGASHPHANPDRDRLHTIERQAEQLRMAGITRLYAPDLFWAKGEVDALGLVPPYAVLVPGSSPHRPGKRWPTSRFAEIARVLSARGVQPVVIGGSGEAPLAREIREAAPTALDLTGRTTLLQLASVGRHAVQAVGNDTGPMHLFAVLGIPSLVLYSAESSPELTAPRGAAVTILRRPKLADLTVDEVAATLRLG